MSSSGKGSAGNKQVMMVPAVSLLCSILIWSCGNEYVCPDPIGKIIRDDCETYKMRYESLKVELGFSIGGLGVSVGAGKDKLRDPSELLQVLMQQTLALCKDFNTCRVPSADYQRRREEADHKFTAITAITSQLKSDLDQESKQKLVAKLIEVITGTTFAQAQPQPKTPRKYGKPRFMPGFFRSATRLWFGSKFLPPKPQMPPGVPTIVESDMTLSRGNGRSAPTSYIHLVLWGKADVDDRIYVELSQGKLKGSTEVKPRRGKPEARASFKFKGVKLKDEGTMTFWYRSGSTMKKVKMGTIQLDAERRLNQAYLSYMPDPVRRDPIEYERLWLIFYTCEDRKVRTTLRCEHNGAPLESVLDGISHHGTYQIRPLRRHHIPLPIRIPLKGGTARGKWERSVPGEKLTKDRFPREAAGKWTCRASLNGRIARHMEFRIREDGSVESGGTIGALDPPWWPIKTKRIKNDVEQQ